MHDKPETSVSSLTTEDAASSSVAQASECEARDLRLLDVLISSNGVNIQLNWSKSTNTTL